MADSKLGDTLFNCSDRLCGALIRAGDVWVGTEGA